MQTRGYCVVPTVLCTVPSRYLYYYDNCYGGTKKPVVYNNIKIKAFKLDIDTILNTK